jgi:hypothetical protein
MNVVLYTNDFEPITVLDLPIWLLEQMEKVGYVRVAVQEPLTSILEKPPEELSEFVQPKVVNIRCEKLRWRDGTSKPILITPDEELALMLKPEWLPGQRAAVNSYKSTIKFLTEQLVKVMRKN